jgi:polar amino acid transport system permease protein
MAIGGVVELLTNAVESSSSLLLQGALVTIQLWICSSLVSFIMGTCAGVFRCDHFRVAYFSSFLDGITFLFRGVPFYVQLLIAYFVVPNILGLHVSGFLAGFISLGLCSASYVSQIVRIGINAIPIGQWEAAQVLGYSHINTIRYIIIPQMIRIVLPALFGEFDQLLKSTSIISTIGVLELTGALRTIVGQSINQLTIYAVLALIYLSISTILGLIAWWLEKRLSVDYNNNSNE